MASRMGQQLGNYRLTRFLGSGGFAEVYLGEHIHLGRQAAIKVLQAQLTNQDAQKFREEARTIARLQHPHIVQVLDFGIEGKIPFLVMNLAPGGTLRDLHPKGTQLPLNVVVSYVKQIAEALQFAHDAKLIHRDIKPENILLGRSGELLLSDFGIALIAQSSRYQSTQEMTGTLAYIAPEQIQGRPRPASDQYSLGIVVYEWLTGDCPFHGAMVEIVAQHLAAPPPSLRAKVPALPAAVEQVVMMALEKDPQRRFANIQAFANALEQTCALRGAPTTPAPSQSLSTVVAPSRPPVFARPASAPRVGTLRSSYSGHIDVIGTFHWSPNGKWIVSGSNDGKVHVWDPSTGKVGIDYDGHSSHVYDAVWSPDGKWIASAGEDTTVQVWEAATGKRDFTYTGHFNPVMKVAWSPNSMLVASASNDGTTHVWDMSTGYAIFTYRSGQSNTSSVSWSLDGTRIIFVSSNQAHLLDVATGNVIQSYTIEEEGLPRPAVQRAQVPQQGPPKAPQRLSRAAVQRAQVPQRQVSTRTEQQVPQRVRTTEWVEVVWAPDGIHIAFASGDEVQVWNTNTGRQRFILKDVQSVAWSPDGKYIAGKSRETVEVYDVATGNLVFTYIGHAASVNSVAWSLDSRRIASGSDDGTVQVWNATTGTYVFTYRGHTTAVEKIEWAPDGIHIASMSNGRQGLSYKPSKHNAQQRMIQVWVGV